MVEGGRESIGARRVRLLAGTALGSARGVNEVLGHCSRSSRSGEVYVASAPIFPAREEAGHEASHGYLSCRRTVCFGEFREAPGRRMLLLSRYSCRGVKGLGFGQQAVGVAEIRTVAVVARL
jgi:hypothetical protein